MVSSFISLVRGLRPLVLIVAVEADRTRETMRGMPKFLARQFKADSNHVFCPPIGVHEATEDYLHLRGDVVKDTFY